MNCPRAEEIDRFLGGSMEKEEAGALLRHLEACAPCAAEKARAERQGERWRGLLASRRYAGVLWEDAMERPSPSGRPDEPLPRRLAVWTAWATGTAVVAATILVVVLSERPQKPAPAPVSPVSPLSQDPKPGKVALRWKLKKGDTFRYELTQSTTSVIQAPLGRGMGKVEIFYGLAHTVTDVDKEGVATVQLTYDRIKFSAGAFDGPMTVGYDSEKNKEVPQYLALEGRVAAGFMGMTLTLKLKPTGEVVDVRGGTELLKKGLKSLEGNKGLEVFSEVLKKAYSDENLKHMLQQNLVCFPKEDVRKGSAWETEGRYLPVLGTFTAKTKNVVEDLREEGKEAVIGQETELGEDDPEGGRVGSIKSELVWDVERGLLNSSKGTMERSTADNEKYSKFTTQIEMRLAPKAERGGPKK